MANLIEKVPKVVTTIVSLAILGLIVLILFGNLAGNIGFTTTKTITYTNETGFINDTGYTPTHVSDAYFVSYSIVQIGGNFSGDYYVIPAINYTQTGNVIYNGTTLAFADYGYTDAGITYTVTYKSDDYQNADAVINNVTSGTVSLFAVFPTIFKILGVLLIFGIVFLIWKSFKGGLGNKSDKFAN